MFTGPDSIVRRRCNMNGRWRRLMKATRVIAAVGVSAVLVLGALTLTGSAQGGGAPAVAAAKLPAAEQPWPEASVLESRRKEAESRALFAADAPLEFTLTADFKTVNKDRDVESTKVFPATMTVA